MDDLIRTDTLFGKRVNIVGNISADLVLESLGKIYIKSRNKSLTLEEVIKSLAGEDPNISTSRVKIVEGIEGLDTTEFKEGTFVFDKLSNILYLFIDDELLELINVAPEGTGYVKRSGDTMTGRLAIYVKNGPPLYVNSANLVENLNAQYLNGETGEAFTRRNRDEKINGAWTFRKPTTFESSSLFYKDIVTHGSIGTPEFSSGFGGYGWRMDADTNTLTIDNLIVRKLMHVYELVVNKISATNGSLWITNAGKVTLVLKLEIKESSFFADTPEYNKFCLSKHLYDCFIKLFSAIEYKSFTDPLAAFSTASGDGIRLKTCWSNETLTNAKVIKITSENANYTGQYFNNTNSNDYKIYNLFSSEFLFDCTFPIITRNNYTRYLQDKDTSIVDISSYISVIYSYFKYFAGGDFYIVKFDDDELPVFKPGDILRCLKWTYGGIKYYDAVVCNIIGSSYIILLADSILDKKTTITYDASLNAQVTYGEDEINLGLYKLSSYYKEPSQDSSNNVSYDDEGNLINYTYQEQLEKDLIGMVEEKDSLVLIGNLWNYLRQNAVYITSTDNGAPFMDVISGVNRPDYSVIYYTPVYQTVKLHTTAPVNKNYFVGYTNLVDIPYTGDYYILKNRTKCEYVYFKLNNNYFLAKGSTPPPTPPGLSIEVLYYLSTIPNENTTFGSASEAFFFLTEDEEKIITEGFEGGESVPEECIILEDEYALLQVASTRTTKARLGNLDGILDEIFPIDRLPYGYGLYGLNVFLTGEFYLNNGRSVADIGNDAITFAVAASNSLYNSMEVLKEDLEKADALLSQSVYSKGELRTAGMRIGNDADNNPGILLWGNHIIIATTADEFAGRSQATALFANGRIISKFISVNNIHSALGFGNTIPVILVEYEYEGQKYYREQELFSETTVVDGETLTQYYYIDELTGNRVDKPFSKLYGNTTYGWNLEATGEGYLAQRNISWQKNGQLTIKGDIIISEPNGIHIVNNTGYSTLNITGRSINALSNWATNLGETTFYLLSNYSSLSTITLTLYIYNVDGTVGAEYDSSNPSNPLGIIKTLTLNLKSTTIRFTASFDYRQYAAGRPPALPYPLILILLFEDSTSIAYRLNSGESLEYMVGSTELTQVLVCIIGDFCLYATGTFTYYSMNLSSEIGSNFIGMYSNGSMLWFGEDGFKAGCIPDTGSTYINRFSHCALTVGKEGTLIFRPSSIGSISNSSTLASFLNTGASHTVDLLYSLDGTFDCKYYSDLYTRFLRYYTLDPNNLTFMGDTSVLIETEDEIGIANVEDPYMYFSITPFIGSKKIHIIRPSVNYIMVGNLYASTLHKRVGQIIVILLDILESSADYKNVYINPLGGRIYKYTSIKDDPILDSSSMPDGLQLLNEPLVLMYMGEKDFGSGNVDVWKSLTSVY